MNITPLTGRLDELIADVRFNGEGGRVLVPERPVELDPLVGRLYPGLRPGRVGPALLLVCWGPRDRRRAELRMDE